MGTDPRGDRGFKSTVWETPTYENVIMLAVELSRLEMNEPEASPSRALEWLCAQAITSAPGDSLDLAIKMLERHRGPATDP